MPPSDPPDDERVQALRAALPAVGAGIYLDAATAGPLPAETAAAMAELAGWEVRTGRAHEGFTLESEARMDEARAAVAAVLIADVDEVAVTGSTAQGVAAAVWGVDWRRGDRAVAVDIAHEMGPGGLSAARDRFDLDLAVVELDQHADDAAILAALDTAVRPGTRLVLLPHVSAGTGAVLPVRAVAALARSRGARVVVDGAQAVGAMAVDVPSLGVDAYAVPAHRWLLGPEGVAAIWVSPAHGIARTLDAVDLYRPAVAGFARSVGWLSMYVGLEWLYERAAASARAMAARLRTIPGVEVVTPAERMATLVTFRIAGWPAGVALDELGARVFAIARAVADLDALRIAVGAWNTAAELDRFAEAVDLLARHRPETMPARRTLEVIGGGG